MPNVVEILVTAKNVTGPAFAEARGGLGGLGKVAAETGVAIAVALGAIAAKSVAMASTFDAEIMKLHTQAGVAKDQLGVLSQGVLQLASQVGQSPDSLAQALFHVESNFASLGITSSKALELLKVAAQGASIGGADLVDVTNALTAAVASGIPGVQDFQKAMGVLNATVGAGDMTMQDLAKAMSTGVLATVKGFGLTIQDVGAALAVFGDNNIRGAKAGTQLRMAVQALVAPVKSGAAELDKLGLSGAKLAKDMQQGGLFQAIYELHKAFIANNVAADQQGKILTDVFGKRAGVGIQILVSQFDRLQSKYPDLKKGATEFGDAWTSTQATLKQTWAQIRAGFDALMIRMGEAITPQIMKLIPQLKAGWDSLSKQFGPKLAAIVDYLTEAFRKMNFGADFRAIGKSAQQFADTVKANWPQIRQAVELVGLAVLALFKIMLVTIDDAFQLGRALVWAFSQAVKWADFAIGAIMEQLGLMIHAAAAAFGWVPGLGPKLKQAAKDFDNFRDKVNAALAGIHDKTVNVNVIYKTYGGGPNKLGFAHGGIVGAQGGGPRSGLTLVGEQGPELVNLAPGSMVRSNPDSARALAGGGESGWQTMRLEGGDEFGALLVKTLQRHIRRAGGDARIIGIRRLSTT